MNKQQFYKAKQIASTLGLNYQTILEHIKAGVLEAKSIRGRFYVSDGSLRDYLGDSLYSGMIDIPEPEGE